MNGIDHLLKSRKNQIRDLLIIVLVTTILSSLLTGIFFYQVFGAKSNQFPTNNLSGPAPVIRIAAGSSAPVTAIAKKVGPSVVGIRMTLLSPKRFSTELEQAQAEGSGVIVSHDGYIMTNYHVVEFADPKNGAARNITTASGGQIYRW